MISLHSHGSYTSLAVILALLAASPLRAQSEEGQKRIRELEARLERAEVELAKRRGPTDPTAPTEASTRLGWYERHAAMQAATPHKELRWHFVGPDNVSGRVTDIAVPSPRGRTYTIYAATASGGVWRTENEGTTWEPIFERAASTSIGDLALDPSNPDVLWVGTGEANILRSSMAGCGMFKSEDRGRTFEYRGLGATHTIARVVVHPTDSETIYVAASGHEWTDNPERGVYKTTNGGKTWQRVLFVNERTGAIDLVMHPEDSNVLYAATWQRIRRRWNDPRVEEGYDRSGIWKTTDAGQSWQPINEGLPKAEHRGRIGIDLCRAHPSTLYAFVDCYEEVETGDGTSATDSYGRKTTKTIEGAQIYRSDDDGTTWRRTSKSDNDMRRACSTYGWVFGQVRADPVDADTVYMMGLALNVSNDSGASFRPLRGMHGDHHALWIDPDNPSYLINGNDGGLAISYDGGKHWRASRDTLPAVQFYNVGYDMETPFHVYGSIQDHGSRRGTIHIDADRRSIRGSDWQATAGGEASRHAVDTTSGTLYSEGFYGSIARTDLATGARKSIKPTSRKGEAPLRGQWLAPFLLSPHNPRIVYHGMNHLFRSMDRGDSWTRISPDLSYADATKSGDIPYQTIVAIAESPQIFGQLYVGTDDGRLHRSFDSGRSWDEITTGLAPHRWVACIEASRFAPGTIYVAQNGKRNDDFIAYLWRSTDDGTTWEDISHGIPGGPVNVVREDPKDADVLYVGTDLGVYVSTDGSRTWNVLGNELPSTYVHDLIIHPRDDVLVIATHGRGMYAIDVRPLRAPHADAGDPKIESDHKEH
ncbi:MAG: hypothetical protein H6832_01485 [Planctomycetes bacterium]|nr:hypothetical protein [Planctomycetota bacterium]